MTPSQTLQRVASKELLFLVFAAAYLITYATHPALVESWFRTAFAAAQPAIEGAGRWLANRMVPNS
ncbi:hypothetical protein ACE2AJ_00480 [Aquihabitans daechungensis]|uniref:hypothetical protein n=1 Tax=Aquihabitans daechungensis TaxID=1052257 RepID=UPI003B9FD132